MSASVEVRARIHDRGAILKALTSLGAHEVGRVWQEDTSFSVRRGALKLRCDHSGHCELIYHRLNEERELGTSTRYCQPIENPAKTREELNSLFGIKRVIRKDRCILEVGDVRIHLDDVEGLGEFLEIEVPVSMADGAHRARHRANDLFSNLKEAGISIVHSAYDDLEVGHHCMDDKAS